MNKKNNETQSHPVTLWQRIASPILQHPLLIFFIPFLVFMSNGREISNGDPTPAFFTAVNLVKKGTIYLDDLHDYIAYNNMPYYISEQRGHLISNYPIMPGIMAAPVIAPFVWIGMVEKGDGDLVWNYLTKLSGAVYTALAVWVMFLTLSMMVNREDALLLSFIYAFGTALFPIASQSLWQHGPGVFWLGGCLYFLLKGFQISTNPPSKIQWYSSIPFLLFLSGMAAGCAVLCRNTNGVLIAFCCLAAMYQFRFYALYFLLPAAAITALLLGYNYYFFGSWKGGLVVLLTFQWELDRIATGEWSTPFLTGLAGLLISPSRGIFIFSPFLIFAFWGMVQSIRSENSLQRFLAFLAPAPIILLLIFSKYSVWWGGNSHFGPRYQIETYPFLMLFLAVAWRSLMTYKISKMMIFLLCLYAIWVQLVGAFCHPSGWETEPVSLSLDYDRLWDWRYNQIWTCVKSGIKMPFQ